MSALVKDSTRQGGISLLRRSSCGFARTEPMVCCSSQLIEEKKLETRVVTQTLGDNSLSGTPTRRADIPTRKVEISTRRVETPTRRAGDAGSSAVRFGGTTSSTDVTRVETGRRAGSGEEEFSRRTGFGQETRVEEEVDSGEDWGGVSSSEEEDQHEDGDDEEWRGGEGGESWDASENEEEEEYEGEDWGVQSLGTKCITAFDCV